MESIMKQLGNFMKWFLYITACILIVCAISCTLEGAETLSVSILWHILLAGFLTTLVTWLLSPGNDLLSGNPKNPLNHLPEKLILPAQILLHYAMLCAVMLPCGILFGWASPTLHGILFMMLCVAIVYLLVFGAFYLIDIREAEAINRRIKEQYREE